MKIIISPAKAMTIDTETIPFRNHPQFLEKTELLMKWMQTLSYEEAKSLWKCNDKIATLNWKRLRDMNLHHRLTPALLSYEGIQYQYMAPQIFSDAQWKYTQEHLRILSGFYGILKPLDGVVPYRLEMQSKIDVSGCKTLYSYWADTLYQSLANETDCILNLASKEYVKAIETYATHHLRIITCVFGEWKNGKIIQKGTQVKMARGEMVRYLADSAIEQPAQVKDFCGLNYTFSTLHSSENEFIFLQNV